jgi:hypothetical protein
MIPTYLHALAVRAFSRRSEREITAVLARLRSKPASENELAALLDEDEVIQADLAAAVDYAPSQWLIEAELAEVKARRSAFKSVDGVARDGSPYERALASDLVGLCFSGGGIRSATFNLGVLQGLAELDVLRRVDYLSSVSGGGYIHQWLAAWIRHSSKAKLGDPDPVAGVAAFTAVNDALKPAPYNGDVVSPPQIHWLRRYSNYLTPMRGVFTADTWVGVATWLRNTLLNQVALVSAMFFVLLLPQFVALLPVTPRAPAAYPPDLVKIAAIGAVLLVLAATTLVGRNFAKRTANRRSLTEGEVQRGVVIPMLLWSLLLTMTQRILALTAPIVAVVFVAGAIAGAVVAFAGGTVTSYITTHHGGWDEWRSRRKELGSAILFVELAGAVLGVLLVAVIAGAAAAAWIAYVPDALVGSLSRWLQTYVDPWRLTFVLAPPLYLLAPTFGLIALVGLLGRTFQNDRREWLARLTAWTAMYAVGWIVVVGAAMLGRAVVTAIATLHPTISMSAVLSWIAVSAGGVLSGRSSTTASVTNGEESSKSWLSLETLATVAPYVFIAGLLLMIGFAVDSAVEFADARGWEWLVGLAVGPLVLAGLTSWRVDINDFSMHAFYRDRLARCYLGASNSNPSPDPFTGFDERDASEETRLARFKPSEGYYGPYPIFCTALNLIAGGDLAWQERKAASFMFSPLFSGYELPRSSVKPERRWLRYNGFSRTESYAYQPRGIHVKTAAAISGAAVSPSSGYHSKPATAFLMTLFNVRLGWWLLNPRRFEEDGTRHKSDRRPAPTPRFALKQLGAELFSQIDSTSKYVYLTDGGHFDNMGLYELVRRRCRFIVICDSEQDGEQAFDGLAMAIRKCRTDFGAEVTLDVRSLRSAAGSPYSSRHVVAGTIKYPGAIGDRSTEGVVLYVKSSLTGDEPADILSYQREHTHFPHDSTLNQWFTESQFESYRRLGLHVIHTVFAPVGHEVPESPAAKCFATLANVWHPPTPEMEMYRAAHAARYDALVEQLRSDDQLGGLLPLLLESTQGAPPYAWKSSQSERDYAVTVALDLLEFAWTVYENLGLVHPANLRHPHTRGWIAIFRRWWNVDVVADAWTRYGRQYSWEFRLFVATYVAGQPDEQPS